MNTDDLIRKTSYLKWRDDQMAAVSEQLETALPTLLAEVDAAIEQQTMLALLAGSASLQAEISQALDRWKSEQLRTAVRRADRDMSDALKGLPKGLSDLPGWFETAQAALPAAGGMGLIAASLAAIPTVVSFATVTTSSFAIFSTSAVSLPLFAVGAAAVATAAYFGFSGIDWADSRLRTSYSERIHAMLYRDVLGIGATAGKRSVVSDIQAAIIKAAEP